MQLRGMPCTTYRCMNGNICIHGASTLYMITLVTRHSLLRPMYNYHGYATNIYGRKYPFIDSESCGSAMEFVNWSHTLLACGQENKQPKSVLQS
jgi:hypothetical protein